jgi:predicted permease
LNWHVLGAAAALSLLTGVVFGLVPALQATRVDVMPALKESRSSQDRAHHSWWRFGLGHTFVVAQIALSLLLLAGAGLFVRTLSNLQSIELGFNRENVLLFQLNARQAGHKDPEISSFYSDLQKRFSAIPGVRDASLSDSPLIGAGMGFPVAVAGAKPDDANRIMTVGPAYFKTMQIPMLAGREIEERDRPGSPLVAVVSELFAKLNFAGRNPVGQHLTMSPGDVPHDVEVVGVARNAHYGSLKTEPPPVVYIPYDQGLKPPSAMTYALRTAGDPLRYVRSVREIVHQADARVPLAQVKTQAAQIDQTINQEIVFAELCTAFAILALTIACVGLYGTVSYNIARRTSEIGIRMALGAQRGSIVWMVLREVFVLAAVGLAISVPAALGASKLVASFLFDMKPNDPPVLILAVVTLLGAAILAGYVPARKASRIDPTTALRHE